MARQDLGLVSSLTGIALWFGPGRLTAKRSLGFNVTMDALFVLFEPTWASSLCLCFFCRGRANVAVENGPAPGEIGFQAISGKQVPSLAGLLATLVILLLLAGCLTPSASTAWYFQLFASCAFDKDHLYPSRKLPALRALLSHDCTRAH